MAEIITMPRLSDTMNEGKVSKWHKKVGDFVKEGDILAEIETDKAVQDFESEYSGVLLYIGVKELEEVKVNDILAIIGNLHENIDHLIKKNTKINFKEKKEITDKCDNIILAKKQNVDLLGAEIITMPRLSDTMNEGKVSKWHKKVGDFVKEGDILAEIETDKAVQDFESEYSGVLLYIGVKELEEVSVNSILAIIGPKDIDVSLVIDAYKNSLLKFNPFFDQEKENTLYNQIIKIEDQCVDSSRILISPLAKKIAKENKLDTLKIIGTGENGRIVKKDVESILVKKNTLDNTFDTLKKIKSKDIEIPHSKIRTIISERILESKNTAPHYYLMIEVNMNEIINARLLINSFSEVKISFNDFIIKATSLALRKHLQINSSWKKDKIIHHSSINIGVVVAISEGLVVPVLNDCDFLSLNQISKLVKDFIKRAKNKSLSMQEMEGSTFSISNLGMFGIECFTSIINQPNSCILSVGAIIQKPIVKNNKILIGNVLKLSLACDHRVVDGAVGAQFLQSLKFFLENPMMMIV